MLTGLHPVGDYTQERYNFIRALEGYGMAPNRHLAYVDPIGIPTIGVGFNLGAGVRMRQVLLAFGFDVDRTRLVAPQGATAAQRRNYERAAAAEQRYIEQIYGAI